MEEKRIDLRNPAEADPEEGIRCAQLCFRINHTMPYTEEYNSLVSELFMGNIGEGSRVMPPLTVVR
ncbi:MAG: galactoside O-acetyltransferase, partial [Alistipes sp.]|nr:galactoside O-acetyltransferase [Alistipes sp.]